MKTRDVPIDLLRVIATVLVILLHVLGQGGVLKSTAPTGINYWIAWFLEIGAYCAVNCFALISGYVMVNKTVKMKNIIGLWFQALFYSLLITLLFVAFIPVCRDKIDWVCVFLPITGKQWWYLSSYFVLFFAMPLLNSAVKHLPRQTLKKILIVILFGVGCIDCFVKKDAFAIKNGYSAIWLMIVYLFGAYIRRYDVKQQFTARKSLLAFFGTILFTFLCKLSIYGISGRAGTLALYENRLVSYPSITIVLAAIFLLLFCLNLKIGRWGERIIGFFAPAALGVYLIHVHPLVFNLVIKDACVLFAQQAPWLMVLCVIGAVAAILVLCTLIERLRIGLFNWIKVPVWCAFLDRKATVLYGFFESKMY